jgi:hypothetical protein
MTTNFTQFMNILCQAFPDFVTDVDTSTWQAQMSTEISYNVQRKHVEEITLAAGASYQLSLPSLSTTDWHVLAITCRPAVPSTGLVQAIAAQGYLSTAGFKFDGTTAITGTQPMYGVELASGVVFPGIVFLSTYNLTAAPTIYSQANGSIFTIYDALVTN